MLKERVAPQSEVIRVIVLEDSPRCEVPHRCYPRLPVSVVVPTADTNATRVVQAAGLTTKILGYDHNWGVQQGVPISGPASAPLSTRQTQTALRHGGPYHLGLWLIRRTRRRCSPTRRSAGGWLGSRGIATVRQQHINERQGFLALKQRLPFSQNTAFGIATAAAAVGPRLPCCLNTR